MTEITFVRHGNTNYNVEKRAQGHTPIPLNETGFRQAEAVANLLAGEQWDVLISSDLLRAHQTAEKIAEAIGMPIAEFDVRLREIDLGRIVHTTEEERISRWGPNWKELDWGDESKESVRARGISFVNDIAARYPGKKILAVTHGFLLGQTLKELMQDDSIGGHMHNTSVTTIVQDKEKWKFRLYNCDKHLEPFETSE